jgi:hypothetical protein
MEKPSPLMNADERGCGKEKLTSHISPQVEEIAAYNWF